MSGKTATIIISSSFMVPDQEMIQRAYDRFIHLTCPLAKGKTICERHTLHTKASLIGSWKRMRDRVKTMYEWDQETLLSHLDHRAYWFVITDECVFVYVKHNDDDRTIVYEIPIGTSKYMYIDITAENYLRYQDFIETYDICWSTTGSKLWSTSYKTALNHIYIPKKYERNLSRQLRPYRHDPQRWYDELMQYVDFERHCRNGEGFDPFSELWFVNGDLIKKSLRDFENPEHFYQITHARNPIRWNRGSLV